MNKNKDELEEISLEIIFEELMASTLGGEIIPDECEISDSEIKIHCWDGRRFSLKFKQLPNGCAYDTKTGEPIESEEEDEEDLEEEDDEDDY